MANPSLATEILCHGSYFVSIGCVDLRVYVNKSALQVIRREPKRSLARFYAPKVAFLDGFMKSVGRIDVVKVFPYPAAEAVTYPAVHFIAMAPINPDTQKRDYYQVSILGWDRPTGQPEIVRTCLECGGMSEPTDLGFRCLHCGKVEMPKRSEK